MALTQYWSQCFLKSPEEHFINSNQNKRWQRTFLQNHKCYVVTLCLFGFNFLFCHCHSAVFMLWLGLGTETTWLGLRKHHKNLLLSWQSQAEMSQRFITNIRFVSCRLFFDNTNASWNCPEVSLKTVLCLQMLKSKLQQWSAAWKSSLKLSPSIQPHDMNQWFVEMLPSNIFSSTNARSGGHNAFDHTPWYRYRHNIVGMAISTVIY